MTGKIRGKYVNKSEDWELKDWLDRNGYRETEANQKVLCKIIDNAKAYNDLDSEQNLTWEQLDKYFSSFKIVYSLEVKK